MSGRAPDEIWDEAVDEGERRVGRTPAAIASTGFVGGVDVMLGVLAMAATSGALTALVGEGPAHVAGSLVFGVGFVFLIVGRGELFTENFLIPVGSVLAGRAGKGSVLRLWGLTFLANYAGIALAALILTRPGVLDAETLKAAGPVADTLALRGAVSATLSAVIAGATMTLLTWLTHAAERDSARILVALVIGFVIAVPAMNHAVVSFGELLMAGFAHTTAVSTWDVIRTLLCAILGNIVGGMGLVTLNRLVMARGEHGRAHV
jgi:formate/nitrite transporter FocA (FNT family)